MPLATNQLLKYNGTKLTNALANLSELNDATITTPSNGQLLQYNGTKWVNASVAGSGLTFVANWNANTNTPTITSSSGTKGNYYIVTTSGSTTIDGNSVWRYQDIIFFNGSTWQRISASSDSNNSSLPSISYGSYNFEQVKRVIEDVSLSSKSSSIVYVKSYTVTAQNAALGCIYNYKLNTILTTPAGGNNTFTINETTPVTISTQSISLAVNSYQFMAYHTALDRYYLSPTGQTGPTFHYYPGTSTALTTYSGPTLTGSYRGAVYAPSLQRVYFIPNGIANQSQWHYIDSAGTFTAYTHGVTAVANAYVGGVYTPSLDRIYMVPASQSTQSQWHYIDCTTGNVVAYTHGVSVVLNAYVGGVFSPTQNRIYLIPYSQADQPQWHYIDCYTGNVVAYTHGVTVVTAGYGGSCFVPTQNRIYLSPLDQGPQTQWHYIDCNTGSVVAYNNGVSGSVVSGAYHTCCYSSVTDRVYFVPYLQSTQTTWHYIDCGTNKQFPTYYNTITSNA